MWMSPSETKQSADFRPLQNSQSPYKDLNLPELTTDAAAVRSEDWRVTARYSHASNAKRYPSNASRSVRGSISTNNPWDRGTTKEKNATSSLRPNSNSNSQSQSPVQAHINADSSSARGKGKVNNTDREIGTLQAGANPTTMVKMSRKDAWPKFIAYDGCVQVCLNASSSEPKQASFFLRDGCSVLRNAFGFDNLLLQNQPVAGPPQGPTLMWDDSDHSTAIMASRTYSPGALIGAAGGGGGGGAVHRRYLKCGVVKVTPGSLGAMMSSSKDRCYVRFRPATWLGQEPTYTPIDAMGNVYGGGMEFVIDVDGLAADGGGGPGGDEVYVELVGGTGGEVIAGVRLSVTHILEVASRRVSPQLVMVPRQKKGLLSILPCMNKHKEVVEVNSGTLSVDIRDRGETRMGSVLISTNIEESDETLMMNHEPYQSESPMHYHDEVDEKTMQGNKGFQHVTTWQVYDIILAAAWKLQKCGPDRLVIQDEWKWMLDSIVKTYGVCTSYASLAKLRLIVRPDVYTIRTSCLELICTLLTPLKEKERKGSLVPQEVAILSQLSTQIEKILTKCFENYHSLSESASSGILDGGAAASVVPPPVLTPAVQLCGLLREVLEPHDHVWLAERLCTAALKRYNKLVIAADDKYPLEGEMYDDGQSVRSRSPMSDAKRTNAFDAESDIMYARLCALSNSIKGELERDRVIDEQNILPSFINLPQVTAEEYCKPKTSAVELLVAVGDQQRYLASRQLLPPADSEGMIDALKVFGPYVSEWIVGSRNQLCHRCHHLESSTYATCGDPKELVKTYVAPLVDDMLEKITIEVSQYERVIQYWPAFAPQLEGAAAAALRDTTAAVSRQCGLVQLSREEAACLDGGMGRGAMTNYGGGNAAYENGSPMRWRWQRQHTNCLDQQLNVLSHEAVLMNSLRRLLAEVPQLEAAIGGWAAANEPTAGDVMSPPAAGAREIAGVGIEYTPDGRMGPQLGAQFAQLVKELRSEYAGAVTSCARRISAAAFGLGPRICTMLTQHGLTGNPAQTAQEIEPVLETMEEIMIRLERALEGRVYVAVCRGLWDLTAKEVYDYVENLQEGKENTGAWRGRQNAAAALDVVDNFYSSVLNSTMLHDLQSKDLDLPLHSDRSHKLLADNSEDVNVSYTVY